MPFRPWLILLVPVKIDRLFFPKAFVVRERTFSLREQYRLSLFASFQSQNTRQPFQVLTKAPRAFFSPTKKKIRTFSPDFLFIGDCAGQNRQAIFPEGVCGAREDFLPTGAVQVVAILLPFSRKIPGNLFKSSRKRPTLSSRPQKRKSGHLVRIFFL